MEKTRTTSGGAPRGKPRGVSARDQFTPKNELTRQLGAILTDARKRKDYSLKTLADILEISVNALRMYESGGSVMRADMLLKVAEILGIKVSDLLAVDPSLLDEAKTAEVQS